MRQTTISGHHGIHFPIAETLWILAGIIVMIAFGDALTLLVLAFAIVTMTAGWWTYRKVVHHVERVEGNDAELAAVTHLRPALTGRCELKNIAAHGSWRGAA